MAQETGRLVAWLKNEGDTVSKGDPLMEVETDKSTMEVESPKDGFLVNISALANTDVPVGDVVAYIVENLDDAPAKASQGITFGFRTRSDYSKGTTKPSKQSGGCRYKS
jgi:pyruvate/2-oxoglutarate dehydrogenase complex dihydrolipoamide acyltransferase (E2) component